MNNYYLSIKEYIKHNFEFLIVLGLSVISILSAIYFFRDGHNLLYADAISRLNISRKIIDNITPGIAQIGNVWLPLPQLLMLPFIWNNYLWQSGMAGAIMSMIAFIVGGLYVYKAANIATGSRLGSFFSVCVYSLNINLMYLQSTAMSEALFIATLAASTYYFLKFFKTQNKFHLMPAALAVSAMTLTRYEGLAILIPSIPMVYLYTLIKSKNHSKAEANTILYAMLACLGFALWTVYLTAIFGDPLYWKNYYTSTSLRETSGGLISGYTQNLSFINANIKYLTSVMWMAGIIPVILAVPSILSIFIRDLRNKTYYFAPLLLPLSVFLFMVLTLQRNTPIVQPTLSLANILSGDTSLQVGFNIRYGILLLPWIAILVSFLFVSRSIVSKLIMSVVFISLFGLQVYSYWHRDYSVIFQIPARIQPKEHGEFVEWMKQNYDDGYIFISAAAHEDQMFQMGFNYNTFIHEGTGKYWKETFDDPPRYAKWVITDDGHNLDVIAKKPDIQTVLTRDYNLVYNKNQVKIFKIKNKPYIEIEK
jgi:hypothetical protein